LNSGGGTAAYSSNAGDRPDGGEGLDSVTAASGAWAPAVTLTGTAKSYAGGGGGAVGIATSEANGSYYSGPPGVGKAGAGNGANITTIFGGNATPNSGSGGGGGVNADGGNRTGGNGGSGVIVIRYVTPSAASFNDSITITTDNTGTLSANGQVTVNTPSALKVGTYTKTISIAGYDSANKLGTANTYTITVRVAKATPTVTMSLPGNVTTGKYGSPIAVAAAVSTPGKVEFKDGAFTIGGCESVTALSGVATCNWIPKSIGTRTLYATLTPDDTDDYNNSARTAFGVTVGKADTLTVTAGDETFDFIPNTAAPVTKKATFTGLVASDSITAVSMLYSGTANDGTVISSTTPPTLAGTYTITPNYPTDLTALTYTNYDTSVYGRICTLVPPGIISCTGGDPAISNYYTSIVVVPGTLTINRIAPTTSLVYANSNNVTYSPTATLAATTKSRSGDGVQTYSVTTASTCSVDSSTALVSVIQAGSCTVNMSVSQSANYLAKLDSATITISKASRTISLTSSTASLKYTDTATVTTTVSGGASDGAITYGLNSTPACSFDSLGGVLTATAGTGTCTLTANIAEGVNYLANTVAGTLNQTVAPADAPIITIDSVTAVDYAAGARVQVTPTYRITGFKGTDAASSLTLTYNFVSNPFETFGYSDTRTPFDAGTYSIVPSAMVMSSGLASNYQTPNYAAAATPLVINRIAQAPISIENLNGEIAVPLKLTITGGNNPLGTVTFTKISGAACTLTGNSLNATASGSAAIICQIRATLAANRNYLSASSDTYTVVVRKFEVIPVFTFGNGTTGISLSSNTTLTKDEDSCTTGCVPTITGVSVYEASEGDPIVLTGKFFTGATRVIFNVFTEASVFNVDSDTQITVQVPVGLAIGDGRIEVVTPRGITPAWWDFAVIVG
jgi:hypothetical protein